MPISALTRSLTTPSVGREITDGGGAGLGPEIIPQPLDFTAWTTIGALSAVTADSFTNTSGGGAGKSYPAGLLTSKTYRISVTFTKSDAITQFGAYANTGASPLVTATAASGVLSFIGTPAAAGTFYLRLGGNATVTVTDISVREA